MQDCINSSAFAMGLLQSCTKLSIYTPYLAYKGEPWSVHWQCFGVNWPCYNGTACTMYISCWVQLWIMGHQLRLRRPTSFSKEEEMRGNCARTLYYRRTCSTGSPSASAVVTGLASGLRFRGVKHTTLQEDLVTRKYTSHMQYTP